jgi:transposase
MTVSWYAAPVARQSCNPGPLAVVAPMLEAMGIESVLRQHLPQRPQQEFPDAAVLTTLLAARLCQPTALVNVHEWAEDTGAEFLFGVPADKLNDDRLGRALDHFFEHRHSILGSIAANVVRDFQMPLDVIHFDPTHVAFTGAYETSTPRPADLPLPPETSSADFAPAHITYGYISNRQRIVHMAVASAGDAFGVVPFFAQPLAGNQNGHTAINETYNLLRSYVPLPPQLLMISDRGTYSLPHLARLHDAGHHVLCSAPWDEFRNLYEQHRTQLSWKQAGFLSIEQQRRRDANSSLPHEHYDIALLKHTLTHPQTQAPIDVRVIFVRSTAGQKTEADARTKKIDRLRAALEDLQQTLARGHKATKLDSVRQRVANLLAGKRVARFVRWSLDPLSDDERAALPIPNQNCSRPTHRLVFAFDEDAIAADGQYDGLSVLVTTAPLTQSGDSLFTQFKKQTSLEHAHHQYKGPLAVAPLFLKTPSRVEALAMLLQIALTAYQLIQREYRRHLPPDAPLVDQRKTTETILRAFRNYPLVVEKLDGGQLVRPTLATVAQRRLLDRLHLPSFQKLLRRQLPTYHPRN